MLNDNKHNCKVMTMKIQGKYKVALVDDRILLLEIFWGGSCGGSVVNESD